MKAIPAILLALMCTSLSVQAQRLQVAIPNISADAAIEVDGKLEEQAWLQAESVQLTIQTDPNENGTAPVTTEAKLISTADTLYVAFIAEDPDPTAIRAHLTDRDKVWNDDLVGIKLETFDQARLAYQFFVNPYGVQSDSTENELTGNESDAWDGIWYSKGQITERGYQVEIALPLRLFTFNDALPEQRWGIELVRFYPREYRYRLSATPVDRNISCRLCQMGLATGLADAKPGQQLQIVPGITTTRSEHRPTPKDDWDSNNDVEPSLDIRWGITPDTLLNATINPDFSQVEADAGQLDVNTTFALFFPEKRPFYLDNADFFQSRINLVNTRNLAEPDYGAKITGQRGKHLFGLLHTQDAETNFLMPGNLSSDITELNDTSQNVAARYLYDGDHGISVGSTLTYRQADDYHNVVAGIDGQWQMDDHHRFRASAYGSETDYPDELQQQFCKGEDCSDTPVLDCEFGNCDYSEQTLRAAHNDSFNGSHINLNYYFESRHYEVWADWTRIDDNFRADLGFIDRVDWNRWVLGGGRTWYPEQQFFYEISFSGDVDRAENNDGDKIEEEIEGRFEFEGRYETYIEIYGGTRERAGRRNDGSNLAVDDNAPLFDEYWFGSYGEIRPIADLKFGLNAWTGDQVDFANNQLGEVLQVNGWVNWKPTDNIDLNFRHTWRDMDVDDGQLFTANLSDFRLHWQFDLRSFLRLTAIYTDVDRDPNNYRYSNVDSSSSYLSSEVLYGYKVNPLTVFYLGYGDGRFSDDEYSSLEQDNRTLFAKLSYAFLL